MEQDKAHSRKDYNPIAEIAAGGAAFGVTKVVLHNKTVTATLEKAKQVAETLGLNIETIDDAVKLCREALEQKKILELKKQKIIFLSEEDSFFKKRATEIYSGLHDVILGDDQRKKESLHITID